MSCRFIILVTSSSSRKNSSSSGAIASTLKRAATINDIRIVDKKKNKTIVVHKEGQVDAVVWNPWEKKVEDLGTEDYRRFVTVESAAVEKPITVNPGQEWKGVLQMSVVPST
ncbi:hypothetical protein Bca52824_093983 [Brassica carinata]|uniref:Glucose-6-phosphate 1-epimerase n=1 Tax=Brassica carinata TaxID=52824 RepID=A0A8X7P390_BRACI|nr:hypothetical protein Bca52824_093983 [Brassica carinata]